MKTNNTIFSKLLWIVPLVVIILLGAFLRFYGIAWDQDFHLHPDERFLTMVETSISPVPNIDEYFNTSTSTLNPHNVLDGNGNSVFPFFVYGTLPLFIVRYLAEWTGQAGYGQVYLVGRYLSGLFDIGTIILVFFIARKMSSKRWLPHLAAFLYACSVLPIQISHFFIVDNFSVFFSTLALLAAVNIWKAPIKNDPLQGFKIIPIREVFDFRGFGNYALFAIAFGMAMASKINAIIIVVLLPLGLILNDPDILKGKSSSVWKKLVHHLFFTGVISFLVFRIFQPYAFSGPGFFNIIPNSKWISNLRELTALSSGSSNYPPSLQWARRSFWFPIQNMIVWGMGLPLGISGILGLILMGWKIIRGQLQKYGLLWIFCVVYLIWQASLWNPTMRYFLFIIPVFSIIAAWFFYQAVRYFKKKSKQPLSIFFRSIISIFAAFLILGSLIWAISFINIYRQPMTRIAASEWIYENIESAVNLTIEDEKGAFSQPLPYSHYSRLDVGKPLELSFTADLDGFLNRITIDHVVSPVISEIYQDLSIKIVKTSSSEVIYSWNINDPFQRDGEFQGKKQELILNNPQEIHQGEQFQIILEVLNGDSWLNLAGYLSAIISSEDISYSQPVFEFVKILDENSSYEIGFRPFRDGKLTNLNLFRIEELDKSSEKPILLINLIEEETGKILGTWKEVLRNHGNTDFRGENFQIIIDTPVELSSGKSYSLSLQVLQDGKRLALNGSKNAKETDWDDALPLYMHGLNPFDLNEGVYPSELNFQMYWDDDQEKLDRFIHILDRTDYIIFSSNRQWGSTTQIPERYPLSTLFYKELIGCKSEDVQWCYRVAKPGTFNGSLGYELIKTFQVNPSIFSFEFNSQFAEEAFTVYDHPKVFIFRKTEQFEIKSVIEKFSTVDLSQVLNLSPKESEERVGNLMLNGEQVNLQKQGGTWSELFDYSAFQNKYPFFSVVIWYLTISILGWIFFPLMRIIYKGLPDQGYPLIKLTSLLLITLPIWILSSTVFIFSRLLIGIVILSAFLVNLFLYMKNRQMINSDLKQNYRYFLKVELIGLFFFVFFLLIRLGNPDLWHPYKGGEKPMDFSYFNAVIKSIQFPPYDPWYSGGYINYYYYGFVIAAIPTKLLGIVPSIAYNLILPSFFSFTAMTAFSFGWNLRKHKVENRSIDPSKKESFIRKIIRSPYSAALLSAVLVLMIGNLGTLRMFIQGVFNLGLKSLPLKSGNLFQAILIFANGFKQLINGARFTYYPGDWYWIPSRAIPGEPITEFPFFTFLYGDPHAHLFAYPITILGLTWILSIILEKFRFLGKPETFVKLFAGTVIIGSLRAINSWDYPTYLGIAICVIIYCGINYLKPNEKFLGSYPIIRKKLIAVVLYSMGFILLTIILYYPFIKWFGQGYTSANIWQGDKTPVGSYLIHWGLFIFVIYSWLVFETYQWMAGTPLSAMRPYYPYRWYFIMLFALILIIMVVGFVLGVKVILIIIPALTSLAFLLFRKEYSDKKRFVVLIAMAGLILTLAVEVVVIKGDIGRMNTVFKFYLQAWTLLALSSAYFLRKILGPLFTKIANHQTLKIWLAILIVLFFSVLLFTVTASADKISDRISKDTPFTLDGMSFMKYSTYLENDTVMDLSQDHDAIRWMQDNIKGTPTIVEANLPEYRWGNRFTVYTGLPGVLGWNWHQRQQRAINPPEWVTNRVEDINNFYSLADLEKAKEFIDKYQVEYIIVGQLEKAVYSGIGLEKFFDSKNILWEIVYKSEETYILKVNNS